MLKDFARQLSPSLTIENVHTGASRGLSVVAQTGHKETCANNKICKIRSKYAKQARKQSESGHKNKINYSRSKKTGKKGVTHCGSSFPHGGALESDHLSLRGEDYQGQPSSALCYHMLTV